MDKGEYKDREGFRKDVMIIFQNCLEFNDEGEAIVKVSTELKHLFEKEYSKISEDSSNCSDDSSLDEENLSTDSSKFPSNENSVVLDSSSAADTSKFNENKNEISAFFQTVGCPRFYIID